MTPSHHPHISLVVVSKRKQLKFKVNLFYFFCVVAFLRSFVTPLHFPWLCLLHFVSTTNEASHDKRRAHTHTDTQPSAIYVFLITNAKKNLSVSDIWVSSRFFFLYDDYILYTKTRSSIGNTHTQKNVIEISLWYGKVFDHCLSHRSLSLYLTLFPSLFLPANIFIVTRYFFLPYNLLRF